MENVLLKKKIGDYLSADELEGKKLSRRFKDDLVKFLVDIVNTEVTAVRDSLPLAASLPESDASVASSFSHFIDDFVYYVSFKQVRSQVPGRLQVYFGWQFTVLGGKVDEIKIRADRGILYRINGEWVLQDVVFKSETDAVKKCNILNSGTASVAIKQVEHEACMVPCDECGAEVDVKGEWYLSHHSNGDEFFKPVLCKACFEKSVQAGGVNGEESEDISSEGEAIPVAESKAAGADSSSESN